MGFFSNLFGKGRSAATPPARESTGALDSGNVPAPIWALTQQKFPDVEVQGKTVQVNLYFYALLKMRALREAIDKAKKAGGRVAAAKTASDLFLAGLTQLAGRAHMAQVAFDRFAPVCEVLVRNFKRYLEPMAHDLDRGSRPSGKVEMSVFDRGMVSEMPTNYTLSPVRIWVPEAMAPLVEFLNSYCQ